MAAPAPTHPPTAPSLTPMTLAVAAAGLVLSVSLTVLYTQVRPEYRAWNVSAVGALALFASARLGLGQGIAFTAAALLLKDVCLFYLLGWAPHPLAIVYFAGYVVIGRAFLRRPSPGEGVLAAALGGGLVFFLASNFVVWLGGTMYPYSLAGLVDCYAAAIPFYRNTLVGDLGFGTAFFGAHAVLSRAHAPARRGAVVKE
jgi:hypothetical protein